MNWSSDEDVTVQPGRRERAKSATTRPTWWRRRGKKKSPASAKPVSNQLELFRVFHDDV